MTRLRQLELFHRVSSKLVLRDGLEIIRGLRVYNDSYFVHRGFWSSGRSVSAEEMSPPPQYLYPLELDWVQIPG